MADIFALKNMTMIILTMETGKERKNERHYRHYDHSHRKLILEFQRGRERIEKNCLA
jgi:penicillin V acylase-like amidase (Ntn superfamily)